MKAYDPDGKVTANSAGRITRSYGALGNPYEIRVGTTLKARYGCLSDGTRRSAVDGSGAGCDVMWLGKATEPVIPHGKV